MKSIIVTYCCVVLLISHCFWPNSVQSGETPSPTDQLRPFIEKVTTVLKQANSEQTAKCDVCQRVVDLAKERFDFQEMSKRVLGRTWRELSMQQRLEFVDLFTTLLQHAYIGRIEDYAGQSVEYKKERIKGKRAEVQTEIVDTGTTIPVSYIMLLKEDQWFVYDVVVEGVSLVRNYKEQFAQIVGSEGYQGLVRKIEEKIKQIEAEPADG